MSLRIAQSDQNLSLSAWRNIASLAFQNAPIEDSGQFARMLTFYVFEQK